MPRNQILTALIIFLSFPFTRAANSSSCPINFDYAKTIKWDTSLCTRKPSESGNCCQALRSLFGIGLAQHLNQTSTFYLPNASVAASCISDFRAELGDMSVPAPLVSQCMNNASDFTVGGCAGIETLNDWYEKVGRNSPLDSSCDGDLSGLSRCSLCVDSGMKVNTKLVSLDPNNSSKCFYFAVLYAAAIVNEFGPRDLRTAGCVLALPVASPASDHIKSQGSNSLKIVFGILGGVIGGVLAAVLMVKMYKNWNKKKNNNLSISHLTSIVDSQIFPNNVGARWFGLAELEEATNGFSQRNLIGKGGSGVVYKGILPDGAIVAVKEIQDFDSRGDEEFTNEALIISKIRHRNLLPLRGFCVTSDSFVGKRRFLVYDFMQNGSLHDHLFLHHSRNRPKLSWPQRKNIILDVAKALAYLHHEIKPGIYHRDIKPTNILLDSEMKARVADFGLAKQTEEGQSHITTRVAGTYGYLAPEYALYGQLTEKSDVYSFGILILEIVSGRRALDMSSTSSVLVADWAWGLVKSSKAEEVFDISIREEGPKRVMERFALVGILCAHVMVALRPTISDALKMLEGDIDIPTLPDRPLPLSHESFRSSSQYSSISIIERLGSSSRMSTI
ncbi:PREDICTED: probable receptor-like protein kinase At1g11050 [Ipomoea nil]|uniref:probable receptor-like protein kinase At1g11050 n=1 Tax=Ipomoea nil TaxID=35883 RepID=UPI000900B60D|nr:PREDICTED: probable receptor-like protein kinase At1g11050 [Ipomoea nil]